jgi:hypothetical protein
MRTPRARTFLFNLKEKSRGTGPCALAPPRNWAALGRKEGREGGRQNREHACVRSWVLKPRASSPLLPPFPPPCSLLVLTAFFLPVPAQFLSGVGVFSSNPEYPRRVSSSPCQPSAWPAARLPADG